MEHNKQQQECNMNVKYQLNEECVYWKNKLLELKLKACKDTYSCKSFSNKLQNELITLTNTNKDIENEIEKYKQQIMEYKNKENETLVNIEKVNKEIQNAQQKTEDINKEIKETTDYLWTIAKTENIIQHMLSFPQSFKDKVFKICNDKVNMILQYSPMIYQRPPNYQQQGSQSNDDKNKSSNINNSGNNSSNSKTPNVIENGFPPQPNMPPNMTNQHFQYTAMNTTQPLPPPPMHPLMMPMRPPPPNMFYGYMPQVPPRPLMMYYYPQPHPMNNNNTTTPNTNNNNANNNFKTANKST